MASFDLIVVGAGAAGTAAALSAAETAKETGKQQCRIVILERTEESDWGGNSRYTTSNFRMVDEDHSIPLLKKTCSKIQGEG